LQLVLAEGVKGMVSRLRGKDSLGCRPTLDCHSREGGNPRLGRYEAGDLFLAFA
jgi:hypothetical protein